MRPFDLVVATALAVGPGPGLPLSGGPVDEASLHVVVDSVLGLVVGVVLVALYLAALRRLDGAKRSETDRRTDQSSHRRSGGP